MLRFLKMRILDYYYLKLLGDWMIGYQMRMEAKKFLNY